MDSILSIKQNLYPAGNLNFSKVVQNTATYDCHQRQGPQQVKYRVALVTPGGIQGLMTQGKHLNRISVLWKQLGRVSLLQLDLPVVTCRALDHQTAACKSNSLYRQVNKKSEQCIILVQPEQSNSSPPIYQSHAWVQGSCLLWGYQKGHRSSAKQHLYCQTIHTCSKL